MAEDIPPEVRREVHARDGRKCRWCGRTNAGIHLHHVIYRSSGGKHLLENLISLCPLHHTVVHSDKAYYQPLLLELLEADPAVTGYQLVRWKTNSDFIISEEGEPETDARPDQGPVGRIIQLD